jgi:glycosyltransferase involved in cell wall biosynthesis
MSELVPGQRWELLLVNDGSSDATGSLAETFASSAENVRVLHHPTNFGVGEAFRYAFRESRGKYVVTLDLDLSYSVDHIGLLLERAKATRARVVVASPYAKGGKVTNVPWLRRTLSVWANRFLAFSANGALSTLTSMVRVYDGHFLRSLNLSAMGMDIMPEIIYKTQLLGIRIEEVPAHLDWGVIKREAAGRRSSMRLVRHTASVLFSGFLFRPFLFFIIPGFLLLLFSLYVIGWMFAHFLEQYAQLGQYPSFFERSSAAVADAYAVAPHTFVIGLLALMLAIQLFSLGVMALQSKRYFEELFHLGSAIFKMELKRRDDS